MKLVILLGAATASLRSPNDPEFIPPYRDERFVEFKDFYGQVRRLAMMMNAKILDTQFSATLPELDDTTELYDTILNEEFLEDARATVVSLTRGVLVDWQPRFLEIVEKISLPQKTGA